MHAFIRPPAPLFAISWEQTQDLMVYIGLYPPANTLHLCDVLNHYHHFPNLVSI